MLNLIAQKIRLRGVRWFFLRLFMELKAPQTRFGEKISIFIKPLRKFSKFCSKKQTLQNQKKIFLFYDLEVCPITFDFIWALVLAEHQRLKFNFESISVVIVPAGHTQGVRREMPEYESVIHSELRKWRIHHLLLPLAQLLPSCKGIILCASRNEALEIYNKTPQENIFPLGYSPTLPICHRIQDITKLGKKGIDLRCLEAPPAALEYVQKWVKDHTSGKKMITITLRQYDFAQNRNSSLEEWVRFAKQLDTNKYQVVFIQDTEKAMHSTPQKLREFLIFHAACWVPSLRLALYELAYLNLGVNNGPSATCCMSKKARYIHFKFSEINPDMLPNVMENYGFKVNHSLPFADSFQKWVWKNDDFKTILEEFENMVQKIKI